MLQYSVPILCDRSAAADLRPRIIAAAHRLGVTDPLSDLGDVFARTFNRPANDPTYRTNQLQPGAVPLEWSFSEADPDALRIELQPFDPGLAPEERLRYAIAELCPLVEARHGAVLAAQFEAVVKDNSMVRCSPRGFGAFLGLVVRLNCIPEFKIYLELDPTLQDKRRGFVPYIIAGAVPHFRSVTVSAGVVAERVYFLCRSGLRLLDLEPLCAALGMLHRFPALLVTALEFTGGDFYLPPRSVLLGIRETAATAELKVEFVTGLATNPNGLTGRIERLLAPMAIAPYRRWLEIVHPVAPRELAASVVSIRAGATHPILLSVYAAEPRSES